MSKQPRLRAVEQTETQRPSITVTGEFLSNKTIYMAFSELLRGYYGHDVAYNLEKLGRRLNQLQKKFTALSQGVIDKYAELDEKGIAKRKMEPKILSNGEQEFQPKKEVNGSIAKDANGAPVMEPVMVPVDFIWKEITEKNDLGEEVKTPGSELAQIEFANLGEQDFPIDVYKFKRSDFAESKLTVAQWMSLNCILEDPYEYDDEETEEA